MTNPTQPADPASGEPDWTEKVTLPCVTIVEFKIDSKTNRCDVRLSKEGETEADKEDLQARAEAIIAIISGIHKLHFGEELQIGGMTYTKPSEEVTP